MKPDLRRGDRVRLSPAGVAALGAYRRERIATVLSPRPFQNKYSHTQCVRIHWDGNSATSIDSYSIRFLEVVSEELGADPCICPRCGEPMKHCDPTAHACPARDDDPPTGSWAEAQAHTDAEVFRADD